MDPPLASISFPRLRRFICTCLLDFTPSAPLRGFSVELSQALQSARSSWLSVFMLQLKHEAWIQ